MEKVIRSLFAPFLTLIFLIAGSGLFNTFVSIRLELEGVSTQMIGLVVSSLYVGILFGSLKADQLIAALGHRWALIAVALISAAAVLVQSFWINPWFWCALRLICGACLAGVFVAIESWVLIASPPQLRGATLSLYLGVLYGALSLGQLLIDLAPPLSLTPFWITAGLGCAATLPLLLFPVSNPDTPPSSIRLSLPELYRLSPLGFLGGIISGMVLAAVYGLVPVYAREIGLSVPQIGSLMAVLIFGGLSLQWPMGRWADKGERKKVLNASCFLTAAASLSIPWVHSDTTGLLFALAWLFGGFSFTIYPLSMAYTCEKLQEHQIVAATGGFVLSYGMGAIAGPLLAPLMMQWLGAPGLFYFLALITAALGILGRSKQMQ
jgi:MFS family permease